MIVIGIDPALRTTGYGVIEVIGKGFSACDCGVIGNHRKAPISECLRRLAGGIGELIHSYNPQVAAIEGGFYFKNAKTAMVLGMTRGTVVSVFAGKDIPIYEYAPRRAKQTVVGYGNATKEQVALCLVQLLGLKIADIPTDSTDAIAIAMCHALTIQSGNGIYTPKPL
jgi:crossover junction endodeoxyribonuclease RuvC